MRLTLLTLFLILILFIIGLDQTTAQSASVEDLNNALGFNNTVNDVPEAPLDVLVYILAAIGAVLGIKRFR